MQALSDMQFSTRALYVPDKHSVLVPASELSFDDAKWMKEEDKTGARRLVHPKLSNEVCLIFIFNASHLLCDSVLMIHFRDNSKELRKVAQCRSATGTCPVMLRQPAQV